MTKITLPVRARGWAPWPTGRRNKYQQSTPLFGSTPFTASPSRTKVAEVPVSRGWKLWRGLVPVSVFLVSALVGSVLYFRSHSAKLLTEKDKVVLADFSHTTGDAVFDDALKPALAMDLEQQRPNNGS